MYRDGDSKVGVDMCGADGTDPRPSYVRRERMERNNGRQPTLAASREALEALCIQDEPPRCQASCPVRVDIRGMCEALAKGDPDEALKLLRKSVPFPEILCRICDEPCGCACLRGERGAPVRIRMLERAAV